MRNISCGNASAVHYKSEKCPAVWDECFHSIMSKYSATRRASDVWQSSEKPQHISPDEFQPLSVCLFHPTPSTCWQTSRLWSSRSSQRHIRPKISLSLTVRDNTSHQEHKWGRRRRKGENRWLSHQPTLPWTPCLFDWKNLCPTFLPLLSSTSSPLFLFNLLLAFDHPHFISPANFGSTHLGVFLSVTNLTYFVWSWQLCFIGNEFWKQPIVSSLKDNWVIKAILLGHTWKVRVCVSCPI